MAETNAFKLKVISPDRIFYEGEAIMLELNTMDGLVGIYKNHMPMTYIIEPGVMTITESEESKKEALLEAKEEALKIKNEHERENKEARAEIAKMEKRAIQKEESLDKKLDAVQKKEEVLAEKLKANE